MISGIPIPVLATRRLKMRYFKKMNSTLQRPAQAQASFHAIPDHEGKYANRAVQLIAGRCNFRAEATVIRRSGTGDAGRRASRVPSLPMRAINHFRQPAIPDGGRSPEIDLPSSPMLLRIKNKTKKTKKQKPHVNSTSNL